MLRIADKTFESHLFTGTGKFAAPTSWWRPFAPPAVSW